MAHSSALGAAGAAMDAAMDAGGVAGACGSDGGVCVATGGRAARAGAVRICGVFAGGICRFSTSGSGGALVVGTGGCVYTQRITSTPACSASDTASATYKLVRSVCLRGGGEANAEPLQLSG